MILDSIQNLERYAPLFPSIPAILSWLKDNPLENLEPGTHDIIPDVASVIIADDVARQASPKLEAHNAFNDIQIALHGSFVVGWKPRSECTHVAEEYNAEKDYMLFGDSWEAKTELVPGIFAIYEPADAHVPLPPEVSVRKAVFKIRVA